MDWQSVCSKIIDCLNVFQGKISRQDSSFNYQKQPMLMMKGEIIIKHGHPGHGKAASVQLVSISQVDISTGKGKVSRQAYLRRGESSTNRDIIKYKVEIKVEQDFGIPGAFVIRNQHKNKFYLQSMALQVPTNQLIHFECNSWIYPINLTKEDRIFFSNTCYLPNRTPAGLIHLREKELSSLRGDGTGERKEWDRIYDYDKYNDLGDPDEGSECARPTLGGSDMYPYPRRGRTGRAPSHDDLRAESQPQSLLDIYVPPDEQMSPEKLVEFISKIIQAAVHLLKPPANSASLEDFADVESFNEILEFYTKPTGEIPEDWITEKLKTLLPDDFFQKIKHSIKELAVKLPVPQILAVNELAWTKDEEFARQMLAGVNPTAIHCLQVFPPVSKTGVKSSIKKSDIEHNLDGLTVEEAMGQWRIFILDHHDYLMPFLSRINTKEVCAYASRTLLFLRDDCTLKPLAIELSLPGSSADREKRRVFHPATGGTEGALWHLAKAHVAANDSGYHQLVNHWLKTHAVVEPFIIATRRQLSVMHPVHRLLSPHFKDTMHINALARTMLINSGGILERVLFTGDMSMQLSSALYKDWRFDEQSLPADLIKRGMAVVNPDQPAGIQLICEDYPFGADGLDIWMALKRWVTDYCSYFYTHDDSLRSDIEIQEWWSEIRNVGHGDKSNETWWYSITTLSNLIETLTTLIWIVSALHASLNYGQYAYAGYPPNRPTACRQFIPEEGTKEFAEFLSDPDKFYLKMLPARSEMTLGIALVEILAYHTSDEVYLGQQPSPKWIDDGWINQRFKQFGYEIQQVERRILARNKNPRLKNRQGPAKIPYKLQYPDSSNVRSRWGITGKGIPNSISL